MDGSGVFSSTPPATTSESAALAGARGPQWRRVVRRTPDGRVLDWVEVGQCAACGRGVDRDFPCEYREVGSMLLCHACALRPLEPAGRGDAAVRHSAESGGGTAA